MHQISLEGMPPDFRNVFGLTESNAGSLCNVAGREIWCKLIFEVN